MKEMDHGRCSELLLPLVRGELSAREREEVEAHLTSCESCRRERAAVETMLAQEVVPLSGSERSMLHAGVAEDLKARETPGREAASSHGVGWLRRALPALGAVAVLAFGVVFAANLGGGGGDAGQGASAPLQEEKGGGGGDDSAEAEEGIEAPLAEDEAEIDAGGAGGRPVPYFDRRDKRLDRLVLEELAQNEGTGFKVASKLRAAKARSLADSYSKALEAQAPKDVKAQVRDCLVTVSESQGEVLATYATEGDYEGRDALLLGFVSREDSGPFNRYMLWLWPKGSCEVPLEYVSGPIKE